MRLLNGKEAVREGAAKNRRIETEDGIIIFPSLLPETAEGKRGETTGGKSGRRTSGRSVGMRAELGRYRRLPEFYPATPVEALGMARSACLYADTYRTPILIRLEEEVREGREPLLPEYLPKMRRRRNCPRGAAGGGSTLKKRPEKMPDGIPGTAFSDSAWNRSSGCGERGIIARGPAFLRALEILNGSREVRILKIGTTWPLPEGKIREFLASVREVLVLDETREELLLPVYAVKGKYELPCSVLSFHGEESRADDIAGALRTLIGPGAERFLLRAKPPVERSLCGMPMLPEEAEL